MKTQILTAEEQRLIIQVLLKVPLNMLWLIVISLNQSFRIQYRTNLLEGERRDEYAKKFTQFLSRHIADQQGIKDYSKEMNHLRTMFEID